MHSYLFCIIIFICSLLSCTIPKEEPSKIGDNLEIRGGDISFLPQIRASGITTRNRSGEVEDMLVTLQKEGMNVARLRIWNDPSDGHSTISEVAQLASELKSKGIKVWITVHYSDWWADPGKQNKPKNWTNISFAALKDSVYAFTTEIMKQVNPEYIQIGNEINNGILWPDGLLNNLANCKSLIASGIRAVRDQNKDTKIMLHYAGHNEAASFFTKMNDLDFDLIGLSYYPFWHGMSLDTLSLNMQKIGDQFGKPIVIAETAYPFTFQWDDNTNNVIGMPAQILPAYPPTVQGQKDFLFKIREIAANAPNGIGFCYWAPEWVSFANDVSNEGSSWENQALWGFDNKALLGITVFNE